MKTEDNLSKGIIKRIIFIALVLIVLLGIGVLAGTNAVNTVTIRFSDKTELTVVTSKTTIGEILKENNIYILDNEVVDQGIDSTIGPDRTITISRKSDKEIAEQEAQIQVIQTEEFLNPEGSTIVEKIVKETVEIPFETITKEVTSEEDGEKVNKVVQEGKNGIKEITYKIKYENDIEIERNTISEVIVQEPVNKVIQVTVKISSRAAMANRIQSGASAGAATCQAYAKQRCAAYGWTDEDFYNLVVLWEKESHWNMYAQNKHSGAYGIPQALPASKMSSAGSDYMTNYETQINWGLSYIRSRYGNPTKALAHSRSTGWY